MSVSLFTNARGVGHIPRAIKAKTTNALERQMLKVQLRHKAYIEWRSIVFNTKDNHWYAWYVVDIEVDEQQKVLNGEVNGA